MTNHKNDKRFSHGENCVGKETAEHIAWRSIHSRLSDSRPEVKRNYCHVWIAEEWTGDNGYIRFLEHIGRKPTPEHSIDRIDSNLGYVPGNVRWATKTEQARNRRDSVYLTVDGITKHLFEWLPLAKVTRSTVLRRIAKGWSHSDALFSPPERKLKISRARS